MKKGFTIIEIIISITLVLIIGTSATFVAVKDKKSTNVNFDDALKTYLSANPEVISNIKNNAEGVIVPLKVLYNDGLIDDNMFESAAINLETDYYVLADAVLLSETPNVDCASAEGIYVKGSWDLENNEELIYICPRNKTTETETDTYETLKMYDYFPKGKNPSNYVNVNYNNKNRIWRILQINEGEIRLIATNTNDYLYVHDAYINTTTDALPYAKYTTKNSITFNFNKNIIINSEYNYQYGDDHGHHGHDVVNYNIYKSYVGVVDYITFLNASGSDGNWIYEVFTHFINNTDKSLALGYTDEDNAFGCILYDGKYFISRGDTTGGYAYCSSREQYLAPVITLKSCAKLDKKSDCEGTPGSENCPYQLNTSNCV